MSIREPTLAEFDGEAATEFERRWGITRETFARRLREHATVTKPNERLCDECGNRVTQTNTMGEVGHNPGHGMHEERCSQFPGGEQ